MSGNILEEKDEATDHVGQYEDDSIDDDDAGDNNLEVDFISLIAHVLLEARESYHMSTAASIFLCQELVKVIDLERAKFINDLSQFLRKDVNPTESYEIDTLII